ncbi:MAG: hypothetical protein EZS28_000942 [Streblomastix strix]|uniref:C3H1-type domain-containing protein n=1 Tax=Streblomastix strix TaxID=222440 RepID=A0A5J4X8X8_9EUKA|nr:MAG: hypothetical protein EZS28_000942 [Streblomastix strix]
MSVHGVKSYPSANGTYNSDANQPNKTITTQPYQFLQARNNFAPQPPSPMSYYSQSSPSQSSSSSSQGMQTYQSPFASSFTPSSQVEDNIHAPLFISTPTQSQSSFTSPMGSQSVTSLNPNQQTSLAMISRVGVTEEDESISEALQSLPRQLRKVIRRKDLRYLLFYLPTLHEMLSAAEAKLKKTHKQQDSNSESNPVQQKSSTDEDEYSDSEEQKTKVKLSENEKNGKQEDEKDKEKLKELQLKGPSISSMISSRRYKGVFKTTLSTERGTAWITCTDFPDNLFCDLRRMHQSQAMMVDAGVHVEFAIRVNFLPQSYFAAEDPRIIPAGRITPDERENCPCAFYDPVTRSGCRRGDKCPFKHFTLEEATAAKQEKIKQVVRAKQGLHSSDTEQNDNDKGQDIKDKSKERGSQEQASGKNIEGKDAKGKNNKT